MDEMIRWIRSKNPDLKGEIARDTDLIESRLIKSLFISGVRRTSRGTFRKADRCRHVEHRRFPYPRPNQQEVPDAVGLRGQHA